MPIQCLLPAEHCRAPSAGQCQFWCMYAQIVTRYRMSALLSGLQELRHPLIGLHFMHAAPRTNLRCLIEDRAVTADLPDSRLAEWLEQC